MSNTTRARDEKFLAELKVRLTVFVTANRFNQVDNYPGDWNAVIEAIYAGEGDTEAWDKYLKKHGF